MESVAARSGTTRLRVIPRLDRGALSIWALVALVVLYLAIDGGGYDIVVRSQVGLVVWWVVMLGAAAGFLPARRPSRLGWAGIALFGAFFAWTAIASTWSLSSERSLQELSRVAAYLGIVVLAISVHRDRERSLPHVVGALATAIVAVAALALLSRLRPGLFPSAGQTAAFLPGAQGRLGWPLNYWNALAALIALGLPLLYSIATSAKSLRNRGLAAAGMPVLVLCAYLTFSRGGALAIAVAVLAFLALTPERVPKLVTGLVVALGSAVLILGAAHRAAVERGLTTSSASHEGGTLLIAVVLVSAGVGLIQVGIALADRHASLPESLVFSRERARKLLVAAAAVCIVVALAAGGTGALSHAWRDFKHPAASALAQRSIGRFGTLSGNGRYDYWNAAVRATSGHVLGGSGPGTYQLLWLPRAPYYSYVQNAHSLYFETLAELGVVGLALLLGFLGLVVWAAVTLVRRSRYERRTLAAGVAGALIAFCVSAGSDWIWQVPALPAAFFVLAGVVLAPSALRPSRALTAPETDLSNSEAAAADPAPRRRTSLLIRVTGVAVGLAALLAIAVPLAETTALRRSEAAVQAGNEALALSDARAAARIEPGAASPQLQLALVLELRHDDQAALQYAQRAAADEPGNWDIWVVVSRLEAETGNPTASLQAYLRARSLNPQSPIFKQRA